MKIKVGFGYDVHKLAKGLDLVLGGIKIPFEKGCIAHSDGDVLIHAICDSLLGAANMRDIGFHFPDNSSDFENIDSKILLKKVIELIATKDFTVSNIDTVIVMEQPKLKGFIPEMQEILAGVMKIDIDDVSIKATTSEKMGFEGRGDGVSAYSTCLIIRE